MAKAGAQTGRVLVVEDDGAVGKVLVSLLRQAGIGAEQVESGEKALPRYAEFDVVLTDLRMPGMDGIALMRELKHRAPELPVIMLTAHGSVSVAVEAMKAGAADFMTKPFDREQVLFTVRKALAATGGEASGPPKLPTTATTVIGQSPIMRECLELVSRAARALSTVLIRGESGTGKELAARTIHEQSSRRGGPFVAVNCAALPDQLLESELFGYEKGAFTGASARKPGRVELAEGGTLFLDEIGDVSAAVQVKLLRLLQDKQYEPLGSSSSRRADVRFIAATHRDLEGMFASGRFREDLFYRLNVIPIWMPALREHPEDIPELAERFCSSLGRDNGRERLQLSEGAVQRLTRQPWPGNVRELQNFIERLVVFADGEAVTVADVERELGRHPPRVDGPAVHSGEAAAMPGNDGAPPDALAAARPAGEHFPPSDSAAPEARGDVQTEPQDAGDSASLAARRAEAERGAIIEALDRARGNRTQAARLLGVSRRTLYKRLTEFDMIDY